LKAAFCVALAAAVAPAAAASAAPPRVAQLVVFRNGDAEQGSVMAAGANVRVGGKGCVVGAATPLAALLHSHLPGTRLKDYGSCSRKPADAGGLYVKRIRGDVAKGPNGWVYKVGNKVGTAGAADPSGPFGRGRLHAGARVTWFYCRMKARGCQRTLAVKPKALGGGQVKVTVKAYDDFGHPRAAAGATVFLGAESAKADSTGAATFTAEPGTALVRAEMNGAVRSFQERVAVK
jgi:hypothetical protein